MICQYCDQQAELVTGLDIYPGRRDLAARKFWRCAPCLAWVGCHPGTSKAMGLIADKPLRAAKQRAHAAFDPLWQRTLLFGHIRSEARGKAYDWLSIMLNVNTRECHIGMFNIEQCEQVVTVSVAKMKLWQTYEGETSR